jgi:hypothetical protein
MQICKNAPLGQKHLVRVDMNGKRLVRILASMLGNIALVLKNIYIKKFK